MPEKLKKGWTRVAFGDVVRQVRDHVDPEKTVLERYVAGEHMDSDDLKIRRWGLIGDGYLGPAFHMRFKPGHVLYGSRRTYLRKVAVADFEGITANTTFVIEPKDTTVLLPELLPYIMQTESFHAHSIKQSKGSVNPYINFSDLTWYEFRLPPLEEQRRIVEVLGALETAIDSSVTCGASIEAVLLSAAADLLHIRGLCLVGYRANTPLSAGWRWAEGREVFAAMSGNGEPVVDEHGDALFLKVADFNRNDDELTLTAAESRFHVGENPRVRLFAPGTVVFPKRGATIFLNKAGVLGAPAALDPNLMGLVPRAGMIRPEFLYWVVKSIGLWHFADTTSLPQLNHKHLNPLRLPLPPMEEQGGIVAQLGSLRSASGTFCVRRSALRSMKSELIEHELGLEAQ